MVRALDFQIPAAALPGAATLYKSFMYVPSASEVTTVWR